MKLVTLPLNGACNSNEDIVGHLRENIEWIAEGNYGEVRNVYMIIEGHDGSLHRLTCGAPLDLARTIGVYQITMLRAMTYGGDE